MLKACLRLLAWVTRKPVILMRDVLLLDVVEWAAGTTLAGKPIVVVPECQRTYRWILMIGKWEMRSKRRST